METCEFGSDFFNLLKEKVEQTGCFLGPCGERVLRNLDQHFTSLEKCDTEQLDGEKIRRKVQEDKCVNDTTFRNIRCYFRWILLSEGSKNVTACSVAMKFMRVFIDLLDAPTDSPGLTTSACDLVVNVLQYFILSGVLAAPGKFIAMLHHVAKHFYKKEDLGGICSIVRDVVNFIHVVMDCKMLVAEESRRSFVVIHQMSYSLYYKQLQKLLKPKDKATIDVTQLFTLRSDSLIVLSQSGWRENKFLEHVMNFVNKECVLLMQSTVSNKEFVVNSLLELVNIFNTLSNAEDPSALTEVAFSATMWKFLTFFVDFSSRHGIKTNLTNVCFSSATSSLKTSPNNLWEGITFLDMSSRLCTQMQTSSCTCSDMDHIEQYPSHFVKYVTSWVNQNDTSRMFDILNLLKVNFKDVQQLCGGVINTLLEVVLFVTRTLTNNRNIEQKHTTITLVSFVCSFFLHVKVQLFSDSSKSLQCYTKSGSLINKFNGLYKQFVSVLQIFLSERRELLAQEDFNWLVMIVHNIGIHHYNLKQYTVAAGSLQFALFLCELRNLESVDGSFLSDVMKRGNILAECHLKNEDYEEVVKIFVRILHFFEKLSPEQLEENRSLLADQVAACIKKKISIMRKSIDPPPEFLYKCLVDEFATCNVSNGPSNIFFSLILETEYSAYKESKHNNVQPLLDRLIVLRQQYYEESGNMLEYALCMIEMSTCAHHPYEERLHWCTEAVELVEEFHENWDDGGEDEDEYLKWNVKDVMAVGYFQLSVIKYEEEVLKSSDVGHHVAALLDDTDCSSGEKKTEHYAGLLEKDYEHKQFIMYLNEALQLWIQVTEHCMSTSAERGGRAIFHNAEGAAKCLYQAAVFYSLLSQNLNSAKASYLSGVIYQMLTNEGGSDCQEKQIASWVLTASQFLLLKNVSSGEEVIQLLHATKDNSVFSSLHIEVLSAAYTLYNGQVQTSAESFRKILNNEVLNENTKLSLVIKSDIYFLLSYLKLIPLKEADGELHEVSQDDHFPSKSPFPPISDCLKYLRSLYSKYVEGTATSHGSDAIMVSANWAYLDKLLICLTRNAELLKHQGSLLEAKSLLKEALHLTHKYHLSLRTVEILQQLSSMELILKSKKGFDRTFSIVTTILDPTVTKCFTESELMLPFFVNHDASCGCHYCSYPKLQEVHIVLFLQYIESQQYFSQMSSEQYDTAIELIDLLVENAYSRYIGSLNEVYHIMSLSFPPSKHLTEEEAQKSKPKKRATAASKSKSKAKDAKKQDKEKDKNLFNVFLQYSFEAKMNQSFTDGRDMMESLEQLISKVLILFLFFH